MNPFLTLDDVELKGQNVLLRLDLNMPFEGEDVRDPTRLQVSYKTLQKLKDSGAKTLIVTHMGRPKGMDKSLSTKKLIPVLESFMNAKVHFCDKVEKIEAALNQAQEGEFILFENVRFFKGEEADDDAFAKELSKPFSIFINDAFSVSHRAHASVHAVTKFIPLRVAGYHFLDEVNHLNDVFDPEKRPVVAIIGGSKVSTKIKILENLLKVCDFIIVGGAMANTFLVANGALKPGASLFEADFIQEAKNILNRNFLKFILPRDGVVTNDVKNPEQVIKVDIVNVPKIYQLVDIGAKTLERIKETLEGAKTIIWNGPVGVFEQKPFDKGSIEIAKLLAEKTENEGVITIAGGGDTLACLGEYKDKLTYVSTAGGAFLEWLEGRELPGVKVLYRHFKTG